MYINKDCHVFAFALSTEMLCTNSSTVLMQIYINKNSKVNIYLIG